MAPSPSTFISSAALANPAAWAAGVPLGRKMVTDLRRAVVGYALSQDAAGDDTRLFDTLHGADADARPAGKLAFVRCHFEHMADGFLAMLEPERTVLEIPSLPQHTPEDIAIRRSMLLHARQSGFRLAFDHAVMQPEYALWLPLASYVSLDLAVLEPQVADRLARSVLSRTKASALARSVAGAAQFEHLREVGVKLFEGLWFAQPPLAADKAVQTSQASVVQLVNLVLREAEVQEIEELLKRDPTLSFKLLRFLNSAGFGRGAEITSFRHAVMTLGLNNLLRWAVLLLTTARPGGPAPAAGTLAVVRGRMMELLAADALAPADRDTAFITGVFSLIDVLLGLPLGKALELVNLPAAVADAVVHRRGALAPWLALAQASEAGDIAAQKSAREALGLDNARVNRAHLQALAWADRLDQ